MNEPLRSVLPPWPYPLWIAHRGGGFLAPENTLAAFRIGAAHGWRAFECDVKLSADGLPFLLHDATLERTTNGRGMAGELAWAELAQLDAGGWHGPQFGGEPLPLLADVAAFCLEHGHALNIEIKPTPGREAETGRVVAAFAERCWGRHRPLPLLSSFSTAALAGARNSAPTLPRALLLDTLRDGWLDAASESGCTAVVAQHTLWTADSVHAAHHDGLHALAYTVNDSAEARRLAELRVVGIVSDKLSRFTFTAVKNDTQPRRHTFLPPASGG